MNIRTFFKFVELPTKVASMLPLLLGTLYALYRFEDFYILRFVLMLVSLLSFDMATTAINNYYDFKKAAKTHGYGYETHNPIVRFKLKESTVVALIVILLVLAAGGGIALVFQTGLLVFLLGGLSFLIGILYSFGPIPISRMPLGELFSGLFMGFVIIFISAYIHSDQAVVTLLLKGNGSACISISLRCCICSGSPSRRFWALPELCWRTISAISRMISRTADTHCRCISDGRMRCCCGGCSIMCLLPI